jgi:hypothetical protein
VRVVGALNGLYLGGMPITEAQRKAYLPPMRRPRRNLKYSIVGADCMTRSAAARGQAGV